MRCGRAGEGGCEKGEGGGEAEGSERELAAERIGNSQANLNSPCHRSYIYHLSPQLHSSFQVTPSLGLQIARSQADATFRQRKLP